MIWQDSNVQGTVKLEQVESEVLKGNPLSDPHLRDLHIYLPPDTYRTEGDLPVIYVLSGFGSRSAKYLSHSTFVPGIHVQYEEVLKDTGGPAAALVFPDCKTSLGGSQYMDSPAVGRYETYFVDEVVPLVAERFPVSRDPADHLLYGKSSGGYGALRLAMKHPDRFRGALSHAGDCYFEYCYLPDIPEAADEIARADSAGAWLESFLNEDFNKSSFTTFNLLAMSACYSPDPENPGDFQLPFDPETGEFRPEVWERWKQHDPMNLVDTYRENLSDLEFLYLDCGKFDEFHLQVGTRLLSNKLEELGVDHEYEEFPGGHMKTRSRYPAHLERITSYLSESS